jgi:hypothetical protein
MQIDQRRVATISLQQEPKREVYIHPEGRGYRLCLVAKDEVVNILLSSEDLQKLRRAVSTVDPCVGSREFTFADAERRKRPLSSPAQGAWSVFADLDSLNWQELDWLSFN